MLSQRAPTAGKEQSILYANKDSELHAGTFREMACQALLLQS